MKHLFRLILISAALQAQDVTSLLQSLNAMLHPPTTVLTITASQGDGTVCTAAKTAGSTVYLSLACSNISSPNSSNSLKTAVLQSTGTSQTSTVFGSGDVLCVFLVNPTSTAISAQGSWAAIPAVSVGWQCSTFIRSSGSISGQTAVIAGSVSWP